MAIITISRGTYSKGKEIAENIATRLGYECISREILIETCEHFNIPEVKLIRAIHDAPSILERFKFGKEKYTAFIREALLEHVKKDNIVYHGLAGHFFLADLPHVLKVRIVAPMEGRIKEEMRRENISEKKARSILKRDDDERRKWSMRLYGKDPLYLQLYDLVINIDRIKVDDALEIIEKNLHCFQTTDKAMEILDNLIFESRITSALINEFPQIAVHFKEGVLNISLKGPLSLEEKIHGKVREYLKGTQVKKIKINIVPYSTVF